MRRIAAAVIALVLGLTMFNGLLAGPAGAAGSVATGQATAGVTASVTATDMLGLATKSKKKKKAKKATTPLTLRTGVVFNEATTANPSKLRIINMLIKAINSTPRGQRIEIMSWNVLSVRGVNALISAHKRGVTVRVLMDAENTKLVEKKVKKGKKAKRKQINKPWITLKRGLSGSKNSKRAPEFRSAAKVCKGACRRSGTIGSAHSKYYLFSKTGAYNNVVIQGSHNLTTAAAQNQWNDMYTTVNDEGMYTFARTIFKQMWADRDVKPTWTGYTSGKYSLYFSPRTSGYTGDPLEQTLNKVKCTGATNGAGNAKGRTVIRIAPDVVRNSWGLRVATKVKKLWDSGCDVRIGYTILGYDVYKTLRKTSGRGPVPMQHLIQDVDGDGFFDRYFHLKAWAINGVIGDNTAAYWTTNGSSNVSGNSSGSDENIGYIADKATTLKYQAFINKWFNNPPKSKPLKTRLAPGADPYQYVDMD